MPKRRSVTKKQKKRQTNNDQIGRVIKLLQADAPNVAKLRQLSGGRNGFVTNALRAQVWPRLLGLDPRTINRELPLRKDDIKSHGYYDQIEKDVVRSMCHFDITVVLTDLERETKRDQLRRILHTMFTLHPDLHYFQGYHAICSVFLLVCGNDISLAYHLCEQLSVLRIRDFMRENFDCVISMIDLIFPLLRKVDREVYHCLIKSQVQSSFTLSFVLTWFSHNLDSFGDCARIWDSLLSSHPLMVIYLTVALVLSLRPKILEVQEDYEVHRLFQHLPMPLPIEDMIHRAMALHQSVPPGALVRELRLCKLQTSTRLLDRVQGKLESFLPFDLGRSSSVALCLVLVLSCVYASSQFSKELTSKLVDTLPGCFRKLAH